MGDAVIKTMNVSPKKPREKSDIKKATEHINFQTMTKHERDQYMIKVSYIDQILTDEKLNIEIPNYINGRPTKINALLI